MTSPPTAHDAHGERESKSVSGVGTTGTTWAWAGLVALVIVAVLAALLRTVTPPVGPDAPQDGFSAARARAAAAPILTTPRVAGSPEHAAARAYLVQRLRALGFQTTVHDSIGFAPGDTTRAAQQTSAGVVRSVVARLDGTDPSGTVVLATHYDTVPGSPGAADPGVGVATILETARAFTTRADPRNDVVLLITDGEEWGLLGAQAFVRDEADRLRQPVVVLNHEARGTTGRPFVFRSNGPMASVLANMPVPEAESFSDAMFAFIPNDTDFTRFQDAGWLGLDTALVAGGHYYHSPQDDLAHLDDASLQHMGNATLAMLDDLAGRDLVALRQEPERVVTTLPWGLLVMPPALVVVLATGAALAVLAGVVVRRRRRRLRIRGALGGLLVCLACVILGAAIGSQLWPLARMLDPNAASVALGEPVRPLPYSLAEAAAALAVLVTAWVLGRRRPGPEALAAGGTALTALVCLTLALASPALASVLVVPVAVASAGYLAISVRSAPSGRSEPDWPSEQDRPSELTRPSQLTRPRIDLAVMGITLIPAAALLGAQVAGTVDLGVSAGAGSVAAQVVLVALLALPVAALAPRGRGRRRARVGIVLVPWAVTLALAGGGIALNAAADVPTQESVRSAIYPDTGATLWMTSGRTPWGQRLNGLSPDEAVTTAPAAPQARILADRGSAGGRTLTMQVRSPRGGTEIQLIAHQARITGLRVAGRSAPVVHPEQVLLVGVPAQGLRVDLDLADIEDDADLEVRDWTHDPSVAGGYRPPPSDVSVVFPTVILSSTVALTDR